MLRFLDDNVGVIVNRNYKGSDSFTQIQTFSKWRLVSSEESARFFDTDVSTEPMSIC
jgi:hypothetical protein